MSVQNYDRHGIENLTHDPVKPLDRLKVPPFLIFVGFFLLIAYGGIIHLNNEDLQTDTLIRRNLLLAMKQTKENAMVGNDETSP